MKRIIIIIAVAAAVGAVIALKKTQTAESTETATESAPKKESLCPCEMVKAAQSNQTAEATTVE